MTDPAAEPAANSRLTVRAALRTDVGLVRSENQDFGACTTSDEEKDSHAGGRLLIVADGMGGHRGGATASRIAAETVKAQYLGAETSDVARALLESLTRANARIYSEAQANPELRGMGTTTSALAVRGRYAWFAHVGDSRIYLVRSDEIRQLTEDHSLVASMVREGLLTTKEAENHPRRNVLQRSMGVAENVEIDVRGPLQVQEGDVFILCSDGLHGVVKEEELREVAKLPVDDAADEYLKRALSRGAPDNVTVIVARVERSSEPGEDTLIERLDETQPIDTYDPMAYDETIRDTPRMGVPSVHEEVYEAPGVAAAAPAAEASDNPPAAEAAAATPVEPLDSGVAHDTVETPAPAPASSSRPLLKWMLVLALALGGAAGAWYYFNHQQDPLDTSHASPR